MPHCRSSSRGRRLLAEARWLHTHLGQIITYAAGTDPTTIVWVTTGFRPEHRAAIDWLNQRTDENTRVFGIVIRVVKIGNSPSAPNFELVAQPNDWEKQVKKATASASGEASAKTRQYREFWEAVLEQIRVDHPEWTRARTNGAPWCNTSLGLSGVSLFMAWVNGSLVTQFYFDSRDADLNQTRFDWLHERCATFEKALGQTPSWDAMSGRKGARIVVTSTFDDISATERWPAMIAWLVEQQIRCRGALSAVGGVVALRDVRSRWTGLGVEDG